MYHTCFFFGNRDASPMLQEELYRAVETAIRIHHVELFVTGGRGNFDRMAAQAVRRLRQDYPHIRLCLLLAYHPDERHVCLPPGYDESIYPLERPVPARFAIPRANRFMVANSTVCIASALLPGNARKLLDTARRRAKKGKLVLIELGNADRSMV